MKFIRNRIGTLTAAAILCLSTGLFGSSSIAKDAPELSSCDLQSAAVSAELKTPVTTEYVTEFLLNNDLNRYDAAADDSSWAEKIMNDFVTAQIRVYGSLNHEQLAFMLYKYAEYNGMDLSYSEKDAADIKNFSPWAEKALKWAADLGVMEVSGNAEYAKSEVSLHEARDILYHFSNVSALSLWRNGAQSRRQLLDYVDAVTDEDGQDFIPVKDRVAVFDFDGTLFCETDPNYFDYMLLKHRVLDDPDYRDKASEFEREVANKIREQNETGKSFSGLEVDHGKAVASSFAGMTISEFNDYVQKFKQQDLPSYNGMKRGECFYRPMLQVVDYLTRNYFRVYVVSGTDRFIVRGIIHDSMLNLPNSQIIGSDETVVASGQGSTDGLEYFYGEKDQPKLGGTFIIKNLKMNKVSVIVKEIGQQPVLSFGNSTGDGSMAAFVTRGNPYRSMAFMLLCDDTVRENGNEAKAAKMLELCTKQNWTPVSMRDDWVSIYGSKVSKK